MKDNLNWSRKRLTTEKFVENARRIHGDKYGYESANYINAQVPVIIICPVHGKFLKKPQLHTTLRQGCIKCGIEKRSFKKRSTTEKFIFQSNKVHSSKFNYEKVFYKNSYSKIIIICPKHGDFLQEPKTHLAGHGCPKCADEMLSVLKRHTREQFIADAKKIHGDKYDYSLAIYKNSYTKVIIICPKHGQFLLTPGCHVGGHKNGCPLCNVSKGEMLVAKFLDENNIKYIRQKMFPDCKNIRRLKYDFYLPEKKILIEYNGEQHYKTLDCWHHGDCSMAYQIRRDAIKKEYARNHGFKLLTLKYDDKTIEQTLFKAVA